MTDIGTVSLWLALVFSIYAAVAAWLGAVGRRPAILSSARRSQQMVLALVTLSVSLLLTLFLRYEFQVGYVFAHSSVSLAWPYTLVALWSGQEGSLLLWAWFVALLACVATCRRAVWGRLVEAGALATLAAFQGFLLLLLCTSLRPFVLLPAWASDGLGLHPLLQSPGMLWHPPVTILGYAAFSLPYAYSISLLALQQPQERWAPVIRRWLFVGWGSLGLGLLLGAQWAYTEVGWGGYWSWDPVENATLAPWLVSTALLHATAVQQRRHMWRAWGLFLNVVCFTLILLAAFVARSGAVRSVHAYGASSAGFALLAAGGLTLLAGVYLILRRASSLRSEAMVETVASREGLLLLVNLLLVGLAAAVLLGTLFPPITQMLTGTPVVLARSYYEHLTRPLGIALLCLMILAPAAGWRRAALNGPIWPAAALAGLAAVMGTALLLRVGDISLAILFGLPAAGIVSHLADLIRRAHARRHLLSENWIAAFMRTVRHQGGLVHVAALLMVLGMAGGMLKVEASVTLQRHQSFSLGPYQLRLADLATEALPGRERHIATVDVSRGTRHIATLKPEYDVHTASTQPVARAALHRNLREDLHLAVTGVSSDGNAVSVRAAVNPLMLWLWLGGALMLLGAMATLWPVGEQRLAVAKPALKGGAT
ncbi:MAG: cytochrome c-type biogenesis CcmF C-terminal domain-containing protein [Anaerolineae bacterium]